MKGAGALEYDVAHSRNAGALTQRGARAAAQDGHSRRSHRPLTAAVIHSG